MLQSNGLLSNTFLMQTIGRVWLSMGLNSISVPKKLCASCHNIFTKNNCRGNTESAQHSLYQLYTYVVQNVLCRGIVPVLYKSLLPILSPPPRHKKTSEVWVDVTRKLPRTIPAGKIPLDIPRTLVRDRKFPPGTIPHLNNFHQ